MALQPPDELLRARRALDELPFYQLVADWAWYQSALKWVLQCRLSVKAGGLISAETNWFILVDADYPWGNIDLHPAKDGGLTYTFPHQSYNALGSTEHPWRDGKICVQTSMRYSGRTTYDIEPFSIDERLRWHMHRAREWLEAATEDRVAEKGEPFELPDFPTKVIEGIGFLEDEESFKLWQKQSVAFGVALVVQPERVEKWTIVALLSDIEGNVIHSPKYGVMLKERPARKGRAIWIRLPAVPVISPWQAPATFGELRSVLTRQGIDLNKIFIELGPRFRDGKNHHLLLGFPIPAAVGSKSQVYHWQGLLLPVFSHGKLRGFRSTEPNYVINDVQKVISNNVSIDWVPSRNWAEEQIRTRGRASSSLSSAKILLIGCGAIGSAISELLVRQGCRCLILVDGDTLDIGNLCRHTLSLPQVGKNKADSLATSLNSLSPHANTLGISRHFHQLIEGEKQLVAECKIIIDCTANDRVAWRLQTFPWSDDKLFVSVSLGFQARRLFLFGAKDKSFPCTEYMKALKPRLESELKEFRGLRLPREGIGCWHPVFPARADDIWLMSAVAVKCIDEWATTSPRSPCMKVYEQDQKDGLSAGVRMVAGS